MNTREIAALVNLLDDPDEQIYLHIKEQLLTIGNEAIGVLEEASYSAHTDALFQIRLSEILSQLRISGTYHQLKTWYNNGNHNIIEGLLILAKYQYPTLESSYVYNQINRIKKDVWMELHSDLTALEQVKVINHILYDVHGFKGNTQNYYAPQNNYINDVLDLKTGNPIMLSVIYSHIARELDIPIYGINLPKHFILAYINPVDVHSGAPLEATQPLFYINPFGNGAIFNEDDIQYILRQVNVPFKPEFLTPCSNVQIINRVLNNMHYAYKEMENVGKANEIEHLLTALK